MDITGEYELPVARQVVWDALNDPEVLAQCIPGCDEMTQTGENDFDATVTAKIGPVKAKFQTKISLSEIDPPNGYTLTGEGKGGAAGFARGSAEVQLTDQGEGTLLSYSARINPGGKLAQVGSRLIGGTARKLSEQFFDKFAEAVAGPSE
jgi:carbon monoxide dehydrogenase subunit G